MSSRRARALMIQATSSHAGKTVLVAGLCRLLARRGLRVVPFKSQNMALNAHVTADGLEMGWAQAMQAEAAGVPPRVEMNPVLLKPRAGGRSQIVLLGKVLADVDAAGYRRTISTLWPTIVSSYQALAAAADVVLIEGAGSPAEPNLMRHDVTNMRVARMARAPVWLVGDIDRGGVFASLVGTMALLPPADRRRVEGFVINKFRGDVSLLAPALRHLARRTRRPVLAVIPFLSRLGLPEEDSVALDAPASAPSDDLRVAIVRVPHIANFTDFAPLEHEAGVSVRYVDAARALADADLVILPGSKDTIADLRALKHEGFASALRAHVDRGGTILGICGGYQMLGCVIDDPSGVESGGSEEGFGLLPIRTVLAAPKVTRRVQVEWPPDGPRFEAYEIHMGRTVREGDVRPLFAIGDVPEGCVSTDGRLYGTYLHGLLDDAAVRRRLLRWARGAHAARGAAPSVDARLVREAAYERLADTLDEALDGSRLRDLLRS